MMYVANGLGGWMIVVDAPTARIAQSEARAAAGSASLLPSDIGPVRRASAEEVAWYESMGGGR